MFVKCDLLTLIAIVISTEVSADRFNSEIVASIDERNIRRVGFDLSDTREGENNDK